MSKNLGLIEWMLNRSREADIPEGAPRLRNSATSRLWRSRSATSTGCRVRRRRRGTDEKKGLLPDAVHIKIDVARCLTRMVSRGSTRCRRKRDAQNPNKRFGFLVGLAAPPRPTDKLKAISSMLILSPHICWAVLYHATGKRARSTMRKLGNLPQVCHARHRISAVPQDGWRFKASPSGPFLAMRRCSG